MNEQNARMVESQLAGAEQVERRSPGSVLFTEGDVPPGIFIVHSGQVDLMFSGRNGARKVLRTVRAGQILGLSDVVAGTRCDCTATVRTASRIGFVGTEDLQRMLNEDPSLWMAIAESLSVDLGSCWQSMRSLGALR